MKSRVFQAMLFEYTLSEFYLAQAIRKAPQRDTTAVGFKQTVKVDFFFSNSSISGEQISHRCHAASRRNSRTQFVSQRHIETLTQTVSSSNKWLNLMLLLWDLFFLQLFAWVIW
jgi:hypothetical protein